MVALTETGSWLPISEQPFLYQPSSLFPLPWFIFKNFASIKKLIQQRIIQNELFFSQFSYQFSSLDTRATTGETFEEWATKETDVLP